MGRVFSVEEIRERINPIFNQYGVKRAVLFGSYGKGNANEKSDIDILVDSGLQGLSFISLREDLRRTLGKDIDLFDVTHIKGSSLIDREIKKTGVVIHEQ